MADRRCFVQFPHPGKEHEPGSGRDWSRAEYSHRRKFMHLRGKWIEEDDTRRAGDLWAWGEWEPESDLIRRLSSPPGGSRYPRYLWGPYYVVPRNGYGELHNTDPFIFGERFLYSNCGQPTRSKRGLRYLAPGSVIAFGSGQAVDGERRWALDTVFVIRDFVEYDMARARMELKNWASATFLDVTGGPLADHARQKVSCSRQCAPTSARLRLYLGATPCDPVQGMYSFFPAVPAGGDAGFPRPLIDLPGEYFNARNWQAPKGLREERSFGEVHGLWKRLVEQVRRAGLVLGTHACLPERRERWTAEPKRFVLVHDPEAPSPPGRSTE